MTGQVLWSASIEGTVKKVVSIPDVSGNGTDDVISGSDDSFVYMYEGGEGSPSEVRPSVTEEQPVTLQLHQNYPNPFNSSTQIPFTLSKDSELRVRVTSARGVFIRILFEGRMRAGAHEVRWDGRADDHTFMPSGVYIIHIEAARNIVSKRIILLK